MNKIKTPKLFGSLCTLGFQHPPFLNSGSAPEKYPVYNTEQGDWIVAGFLTSEKGGNGMEKTWLPIKAIMCISIASDE